MPSLNERYRALPPFPLAGMREVRRRIEAEGVDVIDLGTGDDAAALKRAIEAGSFRVESVEKRPTQRTPYPPFTTSPLQPDPSSPLGYSPPPTAPTPTRPCE